jgi:3-hydroxyacyl-CoA dehydrogenase
MYDVCNQSSAQTRGLQTVYDDRVAREYGPWRPVVAQVADQFLACGVLPAHPVCDGCAHEYLLAFSCKCRYFCPSCHAKRLAIWAQWLDTTPARARAAPAGGAHDPRAAAHLLFVRRRLLGEIAPVAARTVSAAIRTLTGERDLAVGIVACLQTHGSRANWHPHQHLLVTDGGFRPDGTFVAWALPLRHHPVDGSVPSRRAPVIRAAQALRRRAGRGHAHLAALGVPRANGRLGARASDSGAGACPHGAIDFPCPPVQLLAELCSCRGPTFASKWWRVRAHALREPCRAHRRRPCARSRPLNELLGLARAIQVRSAIPDTPAPRSVAAIAVLGAGRMGRGLAASALGLVRVVMVDPDGAARAAAAAYIRGELRRAMRTGLLSRTTARRRLRALTILPAWQRGAAVDLVIEAVPEDLTLKQRLLGEIEPELPRTTVWATNTSALSPAAIAAGARHPERVLGMHHFLPVEVSRLVELVAPASVDPQAVATARAFAVLQGKAVVVARDCPGFFTTRVLSAFLTESLLLLGEGWPPRVIDAAAEHFGFACGPLALLDRIGLDTAARVAKCLPRRGEHAGSSAMLGRLLRAGCSHAPAANPIITPPSRQTTPQQRALLRERLALVVVAETARALQKRIVASAADADVAAVLGIGFPAHTGGPLRYAARHADIGARLHALAATFGPRFLPVALLDPARVRG